MAAAMDKCHRSVGSGKIPDDGEDEMDDSSLMKSVAEGDMNALAAVYDRHASLMLRAALGVLKSRADAEDLLHDVFLEVKRRAARFDPSRGELIGWLLVLIRSRAIDRLRTYNRYRNLVEEYGLEPEHDNEAGAEDPDTLFGDALPDLLGELSEEHRQVVDLFYLQDLTQSEISTRLNIPRGTVKSRLFFAIRKLKQQLSNNA